MCAFAGKRSDWWSILDSVANYLRQVRPLTDVHRVRVIDVFDIVELITGKPVKAS